MKQLKSKGLLLIITIYLLIKILFTIKNNVVFTNIINPIFWTCILIYVILDMKNVYIRFNINKKYCMSIIIILFINILIYFYLGFIFGFSKSLYNHNIATILQNIIVQLIPIIGIEFTREIIIAKNRNSKLAVAFITILIILLEVNLYVIIDLFTMREELFKYICSIVIPLIASNVLYTFLTLKCSYIVTLIYRVFNVIVVLVSPIIPNLDWFTTGTLNLLSILTIYLIFKYKLIKENSIKKKRQNYYSKISYIVTVILAIFLICFMLGTFKYEPITILSSSMNPKFDVGDVVIFKKLSDSELEKISNGSIIVYSVNEQNIVHRVINIIKIDNEVFYQTKGDSNDSPDLNLVQIEQIQGVYVFHIKYIGFPSVWLYYLFKA